MSRRLNLSTSPVDLARLVLASVDGDVLFFDSQITASAHARWSMLMWDPGCWLEESPVGSGRIVERPSGRVVEDVPAWMRQAHGQDTASTASVGLPFCGGLAGFWGYECGAYLDDLRAELPRDDSPLLWVGAFEGALIFDHHEGDWWASGTPAWIEGAMAWLDAQGAGEASEPEVIDVAERRPVAIHEVEGEVYRRGVRAGVEAIFEGELFEVNYSERWGATWKAGGWELYRRLRDAAPGPYGGLVRAGATTIASVSPEQFVEVRQGGRVQTRPIKGTRPRGASSEEDAKLAAELCASAKDRAENVMIVDLMRNDLTRVCEPGSVEVSELCGLHSFASVHHLISTVEGRLASGADALDVLTACFPAGSITGAPRLRAMEWIAANEASARGPYTGSMFYWSADGNFDSNVLIRTATLTGHRVRYGAGGAVVADSDPAGEWEEARWKARPLFNALGILVEGGGSPADRAAVAEEVDDEG
ncbi:anthranilate synthase component I family protein [Lujinxingia vulgaris]|uniref:Anthranilate synthase component I family protein n=1 Tax=Lujinxingia vulgaris TaxID=2600176 RepID=A0A5C6XG08_9DELT|nr:anthranilate synthase component I family protein [Lujinxingia vulgaris]TXD36339.1 anthranilate synthase component I family protein [Lujinxingia vulgaris]